MRAILAVTGRMDARGEKVLLEREGTLARTRQLTFGSLLLTLALVCGLVGRNRPPAYRLSPTTASESTWLPWRLPPAVPLPSGFQLVPFQRARWLTVWLGSMRLKRPPM